MDAFVTFGESKLERSSSLLMPGSTSAIVVVDADELVLRLLPNALFMLGNRFPSNCLGEANGNAGNEKAGRMSSSKGVIE